MTRGSAGEEDVPETRAGRARVAPASAATAENATTETATAAAALAEEGEGPEHEAKHQNTSRHGCITTYPEITTPGERRLATWRGRADVTGARHVQPLVLKRLKTSKSRRSRTRSVMVNHVSIEAPSGWSCR